MKRKCYQSILVIMLAFLFIISPISSLATTVSAGESTGKKYSFTSSGGGVTISLREVKENNWWYEYYITVKNTTNKPIKNWSLTVNVSDISKYSQAFDCKAKVNGKKLVISGTGNRTTVKAKSTITDQYTFKLGFGGKVKFKKGTVKFSFGTSKSVGSGNTFLSNYTCKYTLTGKTKSVAYSKTPVGQHGALKVKGTNLVDKKGKKVILRGVSTHGLHWGEMTPFVNKTAFQNLRDEWGVNLIRLTSYVTQGGYTQGSKELLDKTIQQGVKYAKELGMYAMIDWHIHAEDPNTTIADAKKFFRKYSKKYANYDNVIYEICNEPTNTPTVNARFFP